MIGVRGAVWAAGGATRCRPGISALVGFKDDYLTCSSLRELDSLRPGMWLRSVLTARSFATFAVDDPGPFFKRHNYGLDYVRAFRLEFNVV